MMRAFNSAECERLVADLVAHMTLAEKAGQLGVHHLRDLSERSASDALMRKLRDGRIGTVRGIASLEQAESLQKIATERSRLGIPLLFADETGTGFETVLPTHFAAACSWDMEAIETAEGIVAAEAAMHGINWSLSPEILLTDGASSDVVHSVGADVHLAGEIAAARIRGLQGTGRGPRPSVLASLDLSGLLRRRGASGRLQAFDGLAIADRVIRDEDLGVLAFDRLTGEARVAMDKAFTFLRGPGGFSGIILSEWERLAANVEGAVGGIGFEDLSVDALIAAVQAGRIEKARLDDAVARILRAKFALGLFGAALGMDINRPARNLATPARNRETALSLAKRAIVLLRNRSALLPLGVDSGDVLIVGTAAGDRTQALAGKAGVAASVIDGFEQLGIPHKYVAGLALRGDGTNHEGLVEADRMAIAMAGEAAKRSRTVVVVLGDSDRPGRIGEAQEALLDGLRRANNRIVLVTTCAFPVDPRIGGEPIGCVLHAGQLGSMSGHAIAEVLAGEISPAGKLPVAVPQPDGEPPLPFGHGLSYAQFELSEIAVEFHARSAEVRARLHNSGAFEGVETVQLYIARSDELGNSDAPSLAAFQKIPLRPGEATDVAFTIDSHTIGRHGADGRFTIEPGHFRVAIGLSSSAVLRTDLAVSPELARAMAGLGPTVTPFRRRA